MFFKSPFNPGEKLAQINGTVRIPERIKFSPSSVSLLKSMLNVNPSPRLGAGEIWSMIDAIREQVIKTQYQTMKPGEERFLHPIEVVNNLVLTKSAAAVPSKPPSVPNIVQPPEIISRS